MRISSGAPPKLSFQPWAGIYFSLDVAGYLWIALAKKNAVARVSFISTLNAIF